MENTLRILVVEDNALNIEAAKEQLVNYDLTVISSYDEAHCIFKTPFDVVMTDVMIPKGGYECMSPEGRVLVDRQGVMPYGPIIALRAIQSGVKLVGILTSGNHHDDPFIFAFDELYGFSAGDVKIICSNFADTVNKNGASVKDWKLMLDTLLSDQTWINPNRR